MTGRARATLHVRCNERATPPAATGREGCGRNGAIRLAAGVRGAGDRARPRRAGAGSCARRASLEPKLAPRAGAAVPRWRSRGAGLWGAAVGRRARPRACCAASASSAAAACVLASAACSRRVRAPRMQPQPHANSGACRPRVRAAAAVCWPPGVPTCMVAVVCACSGAQACVRV